MNLVSEHEANPRGKILIRLKRKQVLREADYKKAWQTKGSDPCECISPLPLPECLNLFQMTITPPLG